MVLDHVALTVSDRDRSAAFYAEHFGLTERVHDDDHLLILSSPDGGLLALTEGEPVVDADGVHFGFRAGSHEAVQRARARFRLAGVVERQWQQVGLTRVQVRDPDGYLVEIYSY
jgi:catechol 2,3-dioxygenase-like lactoylglutathione lyase family enzyme